MRTLSLLIFGLCLIAASSALPIAQDAPLDLINPSEDASMIIDQIIDVGQVREILKQLIEHGKRLSITLLQQLMDMAKGAAKEMLEKILEKLVESGVGSYEGLPSAYFIDKIIDIDQVRQIINELIQHGKRISVALLQQLIDIAKGAAKEMLEKILEKIVEGGQSQGYFIDKIIDRSKIGEIIEAIKTHGKQAGIEILKKLIDASKGLLKDFLQRMLERLTQADVETFVAEYEPFFIDKIIDVSKIGEIIEAIKTHGKQAGIEILKKLIDASKGLLKDFLQRMLERLTQADVETFVAENESYFIDKIIDPTKLREIIEVIKEQGKQAGIALLQKLMETAKGLLKDILEKLLEKLVQGDALSFVAEYEPFFIDKIIDRSKIGEIIEAIKTHGKQAGIEILKKLIDASKGLLKDFLQRMLERLTKSSSSAFIAEYESYFLDKIIDPAKLREILEVIKEQGKQAGIKLLQSLVETAKGLLKDVLERLLEKLVQGDALAFVAEYDPYFIDKIIDPAKLREILEVIKEQGKQAGITLLQKLIETAKGLLKDILEKLLEKLVLGDAISFVAEYDPYFIDKIIDTSKLREIIEAIKTHGKQAGIEILKKLVEASKGLLKDFLQRMLERLTQADVKTFVAEYEPYFLDKIIDPAKLREILEVIKEQGKQAGIKLLQSLVETAKGLLKDVLERLLEKLVQGDSVSFVAEYEPFFLDKIIDPAQIREILDFIKEQGKQAGITLLQNLIETAKGLLKTLLEKMLERLILGF